MGSMGLEARIRVGKEKRWNRFSGSLIRCLSYWL